MKYRYLLLLALLLAGCSKKKQIEIVGKTSGIKNGVFIVKTISDSTVYGDNIKAEKFKVSKPLARAGYYRLDIINTDLNDKHEPFDVYLDTGKYTIETEPGKLYKYPKIKSGSAIQDQLSAYYMLCDQLSAGAIKQATALHQRLQNQQQHMSRSAFVALLNQITDTENKLKGNNTIAFKQFVKQYPNSAVSAHLMSKLNYEDDPALYYPLYNQLSAEAKNSEEGKEIGKKLSRLIKLVTGSKAPSLEGKTPEGKTFDPASITKKYVLVEFWKGANDMAAQNHGKLQTLLTEPLAKKDLQIISVSLDNDARWWAAGIKNSGIKWLQLSDLKGNESPNASNWGISRLPLYYLLDKQWHILIRDVNFSTVDSEVGDYIRLHP